VQQTAKIAASIAQEAKSQADISQVDEVLAKYQNTADMAVKQHRTLAGKDAVNADPYVQGIDKMHEEAVGSLLTNEEQRQLFTQRARAIRRSATLQIEEHASRQFGVVRTANYNAVQQATLESVATAAASGNTALAWEKAGEFQSRLELHIAESGLEKEAADGKRREWSGAVTRTVVEALLSQRSLSGASQARAVLSTKGETLPVEVRLNLEARLNHEEDKQGGLADAAAIMAMPGVKVAGAAGRVDEGRANELRDNYLGKVSPERYQVLKSELAAQVAAGEKAQQDRNAFHYSRALVAYAKGGWGAISSEDKAYLENEVNVAGREYNHLRALSKQDYERTRVQPPSLAQYGAFGRMVGDLEQNPSAYAKMSADQFLSKWAPELAGSQWDNAIAEFNRFQKHLNDPAKDLPTHARQQLINLGRPGFGGAGVFSNPDTRKFTPEDWAKFNYIQQEVNKLVAAEWTGQGKQGMPGSEWYAEKFHPFFEKVRLNPEGWWQDLVGGPEVTRVEAAVDYPGRVAEVVIPSDKRAKIMERLRKQGELPSRAPDIDKAVKAAYQNDQTIPADVRAEIVKHLKNPTEAKIRAAYERGLKGGQ
jgi:hypothetical protein